MPSFTRREMEEAFSRYQEVAARAASSGNWRPWADLFTEDATYIEHHFGEFQGREAIFQWISQTMATPPNDSMTSFPIAWYVIDEARGLGRLRDRQRHGGPRRRKRPPGGQLDPAQVRG